MYKFPIRIPLGWKLTITQGFADTTLADWYKARGINMPEHNGNDVICGTGIQTFGSACVWPFKFPGKVYDAQAESPIAAETHHAHAQIDGVDPTTGILYSLIYLHLSSVEHAKTPTEKSEIIYHYGDVIGHIGNSGAVLPAVSPANPFNGAHLHLGLAIQHPGEQNATMVDPSEYFDIDDPFTGDDEPQRDQIVRDWAIAHGGASPFIFTSNLSYGFSGNDVIQLQKRLGVQPQSGFFGPLTLAAVKAYQAKKGLPTTGFVGPMTIAKLNLGV